MGERKLFGTDGVRGVANEHPMTAEVALKLGRAGEGRAHLERFLEFWGDVNPDLPMVVDATRLLGS